MAAHLDHKRLDSQHQCNPEALRHVDQFGIGSLVERNLLRLERHAADRASPRTDLPDLRIHRTGVDRAGSGGLLPLWRGHRLFGFGLEKAFRVGLEAFAAARAAKQIFAGLVLKPMLGGLALDLHAADRIDRNLCILLGYALMLAAAAGTGGRLRVIVGGVIMVVVMAGLMMARRRGFRAVRLFVLRHLSIPSLLKNIP